MQNKTIWKKAKRQELKDFIESQKKNPPIETVESNYKKQLKNTI